MQLEPVNAFLLCGLSHDSPVCLCFRTTWGALLTYSLRGVWTSSEFLFILCKQKRRGGEPILAGYFQPPCECHSLCKHRNCQMRQRNTAPAHSALPCRADSQKHWESWKKDELSPLWNKYTVPHCEKSHLQGIGTWKTALWAGSRRLLCSPETVLQKKKKLTEEFKTWSLANRTTITTYP